MPEKFEQRIHNTLFEGVSRRPQQGSSTVVGFIPDNIDYENFVVGNDPEEPSNQIPNHLPGDVVDDDDVFKTSEEPVIYIEFDWARPEIRTHDYPGSPGGTWITRVTLEDGQELDLDKIPEDLHKNFLDQIVINWSHAQPLFRGEI